MRRLYYIADSVDDAEAVTLALKAEGIRNWHLHVLAKDEAGLYTHKIHSANPIQQLDVLHTGLRYAFVGLLCGLLMAGVLLALQLTGVVELPVSALPFVILGMLGLCFGAWEGGLVGLPRENYKIERYHDEIEAGKYLIMVDVTAEQRPLVKEMMNFDFPHIPYRGGSTATVNVLEKPKQLHHQTTH